MAALLAISEPSLSAHAQLLSPTAVISAIDRGVVVPGSSAVCGTPIVSAIDASPTDAVATCGDRADSTATTSTARSTVAGGIAKIFGLKATLYITTSRDSGHDSLGCLVRAMRTAAVDGRVVKRHSILYIKETVGLRMPDGAIHDGYWYATDVGSAIHEGRIDLYTGKGISTIKPLLHLNLRTLTVQTVGHFAGCPTREGAQAVLAARPATSVSESLLSPIS